MEKDLIREVLSSEGEERKATGVADGRAVTVTKEKYMGRGQQTHWKVKAEIQDEGSEQETNLDEREATRLFESHVEEYGLSEV